MPRVVHLFGGGFDGEVSDRRCPRSLVPACSPMMPFCANRASAPVVSSMETPMPCAMGPTYLSASRLRSVTPPSALPPRRPGGRRRAGAWSPRQPELLQRGRGDLGGVGDLELPGSGQVQRAGQAAERMSLTERPAFASSFSASAACWRSTSSPRRPRARPPAARRAGRRWPRCSPRRRTWTCRSPWPRARRWRSRRAAPRPGSSPGRRRPSSASSATRAQPWPWPPAWRTRARPCGTARRRRRPRRRRPSARRRGRFAEPDDDVAGEGHVASLPDSE
jgi:hypothetical protein